MVPRTDFAGARAATAQAALDLYGESAADAVHYAWDAVGVPGTPDRTQPVVGPPPDPAAGGDDLVGGCSAAGGGTSPATLAVLGLLAVAVRRRDPGRP